MTAAPPFVVDLSEGRARDPALTGGKAAALARASVGGLNALPGVVLTTAFSDAVDEGADAATHPAVREAFEQMNGDVVDLVARSSSVVEDTSESSMAGQFDSVIGIHGFEAFAVAVKQVLDSRARAGATDEAIAVLVQPLIDPEFGGVMFGIDPVSGREDRRVVSAVRGGPEPLVSGEVDGSRYLLDTKAKVLEFDSERRTGVAQARPRAARHAVERRRARLPRPPRRRVGDRHRGFALLAPVAAGHDRDPRHTERPGLRTRAGGRDVPRTADRVRTRPLGSAVARSRTRSGAARRSRHAGGSRRERHRRDGRRPRRDRSPPGRRPPDQGGTRPQH